jgi:asparagine synthase (glutamine-hydrolysing)
MAGIVIVYDPDVEQRAGFLKSIQPEIAPLNGLTLGSRNEGHLGAVWAINANAPVSHDVDRNGGAIVWGMPSNGQKVIGADVLRAAWGTMVDNMEVFDGYYAAVTWHAAERIVIGADILGLFPVYYYRNSEILLVGSSPELFRLHPLFRPQFNPAGFAGIALTNGLFNGQTLWRNVHRLGPGNFLIWRPGHQPMEQTHYRIPLGSRYYDLTFSEQLELIDHAMAKAIATQFEATSEGGVLLSGGLDSRTVAGYLVRGGIRTEALTLGLPGDIEMRCAKATAKQLGIPHHAAPISEEEYPHYADLQTTWQHGADGFNNIWCWGFHGPLLELPSPMAAGFLLDVVLGGPYPKQRNAKVAFDTIFNQVNTYGLSRDILAQLLRKDVFGDVVDETLDSFKALYESYHENETKRTLCLKLEHRQRFHVGGAVWQMSFGVWPVLPALDRAVLAIAGGVPPETLYNRRAQKELLCRYFPRLAAIPLDRNSYRTKILQPQSAQIVRKYFRKPFRPLISWWHKLPWPASFERRHYFRLYDVNGPGWKAVRRQAEQYRDCLADYCDMDVLRRIVPAPEVNIAFKDSIVDASGMKNILGFMLWLGRNLEQSEYPVSIPSQAIDTCATGKTRTPAPDQLHGSGFGTMG